MVQEAKMRRMFSQEELNSIDWRYLNIITIDDYDALIRNRSTGHYWYLHCTDVLGDTACIIFHKQKYCHLYHQHGKGNSLRQRLYGASRAMTGGR